MGEGDDLVDGEEVEGGGKSVGSEQNEVEQNSQQPTQTWLSAAALTDGEDKGSHHGHSPQQRSPSPTPVSNLKDYLTHIPEMNLPWQSLRSAKTCSCGRAFTILVSKVSAPHTPVETVEHISPLSTSPSLPLSPLSSTTAATVVQCSVMCVPVAPSPCRGTPRHAHTECVARATNSCDGEWTWSSRETASWIWSSFLFLSQCLLVTAQVCYT